LRGRGVGIWSLRSGLWGRWLPLSSLGLELMRVEERERLHRTRPTTQTHREAQHCGHDSGVWRLMMAGVPADTQGSTALKALATDKISTCATHPTPRSVSHSLFSVMCRFFATSHRTLINWGALRVGDWGRLRGGFCVVAQLDGWVELDSLRASLPVVDLEGYGTNRRMVQRSGV
jgi:hypothetical protein